MALHEFEIQNQSFLDQIFIYLDDGSLLIGNN